MKVQQTIEPCFTNGDPDGVEVVEIDNYPRHSVLAGQARRSVIDFFGTVEEAKNNYPRAEVMEHRTSGSVLVPDGLD